MSAGEIIAVITAALALIGTLVAIYNVSRNKREAAREDGRRMEQADRVQTDLVSTRLRLKEIEDSRLRNLEDDVREIKTDIKWIREALTELKKEN